MDRIQWAIKGRKVSFSCGTMAESSCRLGMNVGESRPLCPLILANGRSRDDSVTKDAPTTTF